VASPHEVAVNTVIQTGFCSFSSLFSGNYKLPFKNGEVKNYRRAYMIEVYGELGANSLIG
jgi:hypothetical protein